MGNTLLPGQRLNLNESLTSTNGLFELVMQSDGNLVLYRRANHHPVWDSRTTGQDIQHAVMQHDGNFVVYDFNGRPRWSSETETHPHSWLKLLNTGNLVIVTAEVTWYTQCQEGKPPHDLPYFLPG